MHYVPEKSAFVWKIKQLAGGKDYLMRAHFGLPSVRGGEYQSTLLPFPPSRCRASLGVACEADLPHFAEEMDKRAPISIKFEIPYFTVSGIQVRYLKVVEKSGYQALPWVRYVHGEGEGAFTVDRH